MDREKAKGGSECVVTGMGELGVQQGELHHGCLEESHLRSYGPGSAYQGMFCFCSGNQSLELRLREKLKKQILQFERENQRCR